MFYLINAVQTGVARREDRPIVPVREVKGPSGRLILVEEETDRLAVERFNKEMETARKGMALSVTHPSKLGPRLGGGDIKWMSRAKGGLNPSRLDYDIYQEVSRFFKKDEEGGVLLLLGLEYLSVLNGFKMVAKVLKKIGDRASSSGGALIVDMNPMAFDKKQVAVLEKMFDYVERSGAGVRVVEKLVPGSEEAGWSYLVLDKKGYRGLARFGEDGVCVTTLQPEKVRRWDDYKGTVIWVSESDDKEAVHPSKLRYEIQQRVLKAVSEGGKEVYVDGLEHLILYTGLDEVVGFVKSVSDACAQAGAFMVATLNPKSLERRDFALFKRMFDKVVG
jgi:hypothetical protein